MIMRMSPASLSSLQLSLQDLRKEGGGSCKWMLPLSRGDSWEASVVADSRHLYPGPTGVYNFVAASLMLGFAHLMPSSTETGSAHQLLFRFNMVWEIVCFQSEPSYDG